MLATFFFFQPTEYNDDSSYPADFIHVTETVLDGKFYANIK